MREQMPTPVGSRGLVLPLGAASLVALLGVLAACKDDKVEDEKAPPESPNRATLADNAHGVKREPLAIDDGTITFADDEESKTFAVGDVLAPRERIAKPYLRKITGVERKGGRAIFKTQNAALTQLFKQAHIHQKIAFGDPKWTSMNAEVMVKPQSAPAAGLIRPLEFEALPSAAATFKFGGKPVDFAIDGAYFDPSESYVQVGGGLEFDYDYEAWYDPTPTLVHLAASGWFQAKVGARFGASGSVSGNVFDEAWPYKPHLGTIYFQAGLVPIFIDVGMVFATKIDTSINAKIDVHAATTVHYGMRAGIHYERGSWTPINELTNELQDELSVNGSATVSLGVHPINTKMQFMLYGLVGPYVELDPYMSVSGGLHAGDFKREIGLKGSAGGNIEVLGYSLGDFKVDLFDWSHELDTMKACISASRLDDGSTLGTSRCKLGPVKNCASARTGGGAACAAPVCGSPDGYDAICDVDRLFQCECEKLYLREEPGRAPIAPAGADGDCAKRYCAPCTKDQTVCPL